MNKTQKGAWGGLVLVVFLLMIPVIDIIEKGLGPLLTHLVAYSVGLPLLVLVIYLIRKIENQPGVGFDERDKLIIKKAIIVAFTIVSIALIAWYILTLFWLGEAGFISVSKLPVIVYTASILFIFVCSLTVLVQYGRKEKNHE
jgi:fatty acid desaturase